MTSVAQPRTPASDSDDNDSGARLRMKPDGPASGRVDGGWWPRSRDLAVEIPPLAAALAEHLGTRLRISYDIAAWDPAPRRVASGGSIVRLGGYRYQPAGTVDVAGGVHHLVLTVVPSDTDDETARTALAAAASTTTEGRH